MRRRLFLARAACFAGSLGGCTGLLGIDGASYTLAGPDAAADASDEDASATDATSDAPDALDASDADVNVDASDADASDAIATSDADANDAEAASDAHASDADSSDAPDASDASDADANVDASDTDASDASDADANVDASDADARSDASDAASDAPDAADASDADGAPLDASDGGAVSWCGTGVPASNWAKWPVPNPVASGLPNPASYAISAGQGMVRDQVTGLTWQRNVDPGSYTQADAATYCASLVVEGCAGWRLPTRIELLSILDWTQSSPAIDRVTFPSTPLALFWTSTLQAGATGRAWAIDFDVGVPGGGADATTMHRVRCVR